MQSLSTSFDQATFRAELSLINGKIAVSSSRDGFTIFDRTGEPGVSIAGSWGDYDGDSLRDEEEVRDWIYQMYFAVEGR